MKLTKLIFVITLFFLFTCCSKKKIETQIEKQNIEEPINTKKFYLNYFNDEKKIAILSDKIKVKGDTIAYKELSYIYKLSGHDNDFLYYSFIMANDFKYNRAYYDVYIALSKLNINNHEHTNGFSLENLDKENKKLAIEYLKKASKGGLKEANKILKLINSK